MEEDQFAKQSRQIIKGVILTSVFWVAVWWIVHVLDIGSKDVTIAVSIVGTGFALTYIEPYKKVFRHVSDRLSKKLHRTSLVNNIAVKSSGWALIFAIVTGILGLYLLEHLGYREAVPWILLGCAIWGGLNAILTLRRLAKGNYGDADYELRELIAPLAARIYKGRDPNDPNGVFPERSVERPTPPATQGRATI